MLLMIRPLELRGRRLTAVLEGTGKVRVVLDIEGNGDRLFVYDESLYYDVVQGGMGLKNTVVL